MALTDWQIARDVKITPFVEAQKSKGAISFGCGSMGYDMRVGYKFKIFTPTYSTEIDPKNFNDKVFVDMDLTPYIHNDLTYEGSLGLEKWYQCQYCSPTGHNPGLCGKPCPNQPNFIRIPPNSYCLCQSIEHFEIPRDVIGIVLGKSTYARSGIIVNCTPMEPGWKGYLTIEISNAAPLPARIYAAEGIAQVIFLRTDGYREAQQLILAKTIESLNPLSDCERLLYYYHEQISHATCRTSYEDRAGRYNDQKEITLPFVNKE